MRRIYGTYHLSVHRESIQESFVAASSSLLFVPSSKEAFDVGRGFATKEDAGSSYQHPTAAMEELTLQEGDRVVEDHGVDTIVTPDAGVEYNFGPASFRDSVLYTSERPGGNATGQAKIPSSTVVPKFIAFMKDHNISHVIVLLDEEELDVYESPGLLELYRQGNMEFHFIPASSKHASLKIMAVLEEIASRGERAVGHCTHGMGRSGRLAAAWLVKQYGLSSVEATKETLETARQCGVERMGAPGKLREWLDK